MRVSYPIVRESYHVFPLISLCIVRVSYVIHSEVMRRFYGKNQRCSRSGFRFVKQIILRNRSYVNMALNSRRRIMSEKIKTAIFQYLLMHLSVDKLKVIVHAFVGSSKQFVPS